MEKIAYKPVSSTCVDRDELINTHFGLAIAVARRLTGRRDEDVEQVALMGLVKAADRFDPTLAVSFSTFAWQTVAGEVKRHFRDTTWSVHVCRSLHEREQQVKSSIEDLTSLYRRAPTTSEIAQHVECSTEQVLEVLEMAANARPESLSANEGKNTTPIDIGDIELGFAKTENRQLINGLLRYLSEQERKVVYLKFCEQLSQAEIGIRLGVSQMHVSRLLNRSLGRLREAAARPDAETVG